MARSAGRQGARGQNARGALGHVAQAQEQQAADRQAAEHQPWRAPQTEPGNRRNDDDRSQRAPQLAAHHPEAHPAPQAPARKVPGHDGSDRVQPRRVHPSDEQQRGQQDVARAHAQHAHHHGGDRRGEDHQVAQADAIGRVPDKRLRQGRSLQEHVEEPGLRVGQHELRLERREQRRQKSCISIVQRVGSADGAHAAGAEWRRRGCRAGGHCVEGSLAPCPVSCRPRRRPAP